MNATTSSPASRVSRITSIDALRGLVMFAMIFVNDLAGVGKIAPDWMVHFSDRHHRDSGMTFVDLVFPAFLFIVGMSIPFALGSRLNKGEPLWKIIFHISVRTVSLLFIGILMVHESPDSEKLGWPGALWSTLMFLSAIFAFSSFSLPGRPETAARRERILKLASLLVRGLGFAALFYLALVFCDKKNHHIITLFPLAINTSWYGILGLIGWAYLVSAMVFLFFRNHRTALLGCVTLLLCLYPAGRTGAFDNFWLNHYVGIGEMLGAHPAIAVAGLLLGSILVSADIVTLRARVKFTLLFIAGCSAGALLLNGLYGISKNNATPSWCLWSAAVTAALWLLFYLLADVCPQQRVARLARPFSIAGQNVLLAYLFSEMLPAVLELFHLDDWYSGLAEHGLACAIIRSAGCAVVLLALTALLNRAGFRLKL
jgi:heparan-alpha-glucosaminide N-acetyltransferase